MKTRSPHGTATASHSAGQMASHQRKNVLAGNRKKKIRAQKRRRAKHYAAPVFPAKTLNAVPPSTLIFYECLLRACSAYKHQALAKCNNVYDNAKSAAAVDAVATSQNRLPHSPVLRTSLSLSLSLARARMS